MGANTKISAKTYFEEQWWQLKDRNDPMARHGSVNVIRQKIDENQTNANALLESQYISGTSYAHNPKIKDRF